MQIVVSVKRIRREFGAPCTFSDRNADKIKDGIIECPAYDERAFDLKRMELDRGTQVSWKLYTRLAYTVISKCGVTLEKKVGWLKTERTRWTLANTRQLMINYFKVTWRWARGSHVPCYITAISSLLNALHVQNTLCNCWSSWEYWRINCICNTMYSCVSAAQAVPELVDIAVQTNWKYPKNAVVQCQPREFTEEEKLAIQESEELAVFLRNVAQRFVVCMQFTSLCVTVFLYVTLTELCSGCFARRALSNIYFNS